MFFLNIYKIFYSHVLYIFCTSHSRSWLTRCLIFFCVTNFFSTKKNTWKAQNHGKQILLASHNKIKRKFIFLLKFSCEDGLNCNERCFFVSVFIIFMCLYTNFIFFFSNIPRNMKQDSDYIIYVFVL